MSGYLLSAHSTIRSKLSPSHLMAFVFSTMFFGSTALAGVVTHSGSITSQTIWSSADIHVIDGDVTVNSGVLLTIQPGTIVKVKSGSLVVNGALSADGNASEPIYFTSYKDDSIGGDTNGDGTTSAPAKGDWTRINLSSTVIA